MQVSLQPFGFVGINATTGFFVHSFSITDFAAFNTFCSSSFGRVSAFSLLSIILFAYWDFVSPIIIGNAVSLSCCKIPSQRRSGL